MTAPASWWHAFPALKAIEDPRWQALMACAQAVRIPAGTTIFRAGEQCRAELGYRPARWYRGS